MSAISLKQQARILHQLHFEKPKSMEKAKQSRFLWINWKRIVNRVRTILAIAELAWVEWVFKPSEQSLSMDTEQEQIT